MSDQAIAVAVFDTVLVFFAHVVTDAIDARLCAVADLVFAGDAIIVVVGI